MAAISHGAVLTSVADSATAANLVTARTLATGQPRRGLIIHNDSTEILYIAYGATATTTAYTYKIPVDAHWEMIDPIYQGRISGIWANNASGSARITELY